MSTRSGLRLFVLRVLVISVLLTLLGRLWYLQVYAAARYTKAAQDNRIREVVQPAPRGMIYDSSGRRIVENRTVMVISVNRSIIRAERDGGKDVLARLAGVIGIRAVDIARLITPCGSRYPDGTPSRGPDCWNGSPYQPVPVRSYSADDPRQAQPALKILEHREDFPGVTAELQPVRYYPDGTMAAHLLGYLAPITDAERKDPKYAGLTTAKVGRGGVEQTYDVPLRGHDGVQELLVDKDGNVTGVQSDTKPQAGDSLILSLDENVQKLAESALQKGIVAARQRTDRNRGGIHYKAPTGAVVVMEARTGRIAAMASYPSYDPSIFTKPILPTATYKALTDPKKGAPLYSNATQGTFAPGSTFKLVSTAAAVAAGNSLTGYYPCPPALRVGNRLFRNFEGETFGTINFRTTLIKSCDTVYYGLAYREWQRDGGTKKNPKAREVFPKMAKSFGFGSPTGIDLPSDSAGLITDRAYKQANWDAMKDDYCLGAKRRPPGSYLQLIDQEACTDGWRYNAGDAANFSIGQGDVTVSPLQLATAYAALANGGTLYEPRLAKALLSADGTRVTPIPSKVKGKLPVAPGTLAYIRSALTEVTKPGGTAQAAYAGFPQGLVAGKTGTADVHDKQPTGWFASFAPAANPRYVVVAMITEAGTGGSVSAPVTRQIYDGIFGLEGHKALLPGGALPSKLPVVRADGTIAPPGSHTGRPAPQVVPLAPSPTASPASALPPMDRPRRTHSEA
ncbi:MAG: penicillin-binding protein 2 [Actinomycetota bacterium]|jgi:penicillin-binding protein 2|nr:penicillin-binding protein 2 [Actinomycetota bacterium]